MLLAVTILIALVANSMRPASEEARLATLREEVHLAKLRVRALEQQQNQLEQKPSAGGVKRWPLSIEGLRAAQPLFAKVTEAAARGAKAAGKFVAIASLQLAGNMSAAGAQKAGNFTAAAGAWLKRELQGAKAAGIVAIASVQLAGNMSAAGAQKAGNFTAAVGAWLGREFQGRRNKEPNAVSLWQPTASRRPLVRTRIDRKTGFADLRARGLV